MLKSRDITLPPKVHIVKAMFFPVVMYRHESWTIKKAEHRRIDAFELWCWRRPWESLGLQGDLTVHPKGNQSWIFIGRTDAEAETPILRSPDAKNWLISKDLQQRMLKRKVLWSPDCSLRKRFGCPRREGGGQVYPIGLNSGSIKFCFSS